MAEQILPNPGDADFAPNIIEAKALESVEEQFEAKKKIFDAEKESLLLRATAKDDQSAIERIEERFKQVEKYHDIRLEMAKKIEDREKAIAKIADEGERNVALLALERQKKEMQFEEIKTRAAERYETTQTKLGDIWDDLTDPVKFLKRKAKEATILTVAHFLRMKREKQVENQRIEGMEKSLDGVGGFMEQGETESPEETKKYHAEMLGIMGRLTTSTEESTAEQITQNKKDSRISASEESASEMLNVESPLALPAPKEKKEKKDFFSMLMKMVPVLSGVASSVTGAVGGIASSIAGAVGLKSAANMLGGGSKAAKVLPKTGFMAPKGAGKTGGKIASKIGAKAAAKGAGRLAARAIPGIGMGLMAAEGISMAAGSLMSEEGGGTAALELNRMNTDDHEVVDLELFGKSQIKDWNVVESLPINKIQGLINYDDWDNSTMSRFKEIIASKEKTASGELEPQAPTDTKAKKMAGAMENRALESGKQSKGAQPKETNTVVNAPTTNVTNNTIEDRAFNNDPTTQQLNPWAVRGQYA
jgi:hypothetical protein